MEIQGQQVNDVKSKTNERPIQLREGEVYRARVESRVSDREAILSIRGQEVKATFEGKVPSRDRISIQVQERTKDGVRVREIAGDSRSAQRQGAGSNRVTDQQSAERVLRELGHREPSSELRQAAQQLMNRGVPLTRESAHDLNRYLESGRGTERQREQTVQMMAQKRLEPTTAQLRNVHEALHGSKVAENVKSMTNSQQQERTSEGNRFGRMDTVRNELGRAIEQIRTAVRNGGDMREHIQQVREQINRLGDQQVRRELNQMLREALRPDRNEASRPVTESQPQQATRMNATVQGETVRAVEQVRSSLQSGQNLRQSIEQLQQVVQRTGDGETRQRVNQALREMIQIQAKSGREAASVRIMQLSQQLVQQAQPGGPTSQASVQANTGTPSQQIQNFSAVIQNEANVTTAIETVRNQMFQGNLPSQVTERIGATMNEALSLLETGRELKARQVLSDTLKQVEQMTLRDQMQQAPFSESRSQMQEYMRSEIIPATNLSSKNILITEVTERLAQATDEFKAFQRDALKQLNRVETMMNQFRQNAMKQTQPMLENVIKQMDKAIMKSDWMLFTDMKTERRLLGASSKLADAKKLLTQGKHIEARQIVRQVQQTMNQINFRPSNQRVQHVLSQEQQWNEPKAPVHRLSQQMEQTARSFLAHEGSSRQVFEGLRAIGLNREAELAQIFAAGKEVPTEAQQRNLKSILMQMARGEEEGRNQQQQQAQQSLQNMTGQQLLSRNDTSQQNQMHLFQLPLMIKGEAENLQVYVNSRNKGEIVDWENFSIYFHMDTKNLGPLGIALNVTDRMLNVTLKNDTDGFANDVEPLAQKYIDQLKEVGYEVNNLKVSPMTVKEAPSVTNEEAAILPIMTEEGFDYKI